MFEINPDHKLTTETLDGSTIYTIDDFYQNPDEIVGLLSWNQPYLHKAEDEDSYNGIYFKDLRHSINRPELRNVYRWLSKLCKRRPHGSTSKLQTNVFQMDKYYTIKNPYKETYWWPHHDPGYTALIYLNKDDTENGTNLYRNLCPEKEPPKIPEHSEPWRPKERFELLKSLNPRYNRLVLFDGNKFLHGMNICDQRYYEYFRINQALFFGML